MGVDFPATLTTSGTDQFTVGATLTTISGANLGGAATLDYGAADYDNTTGLTISITF